MTLTPRTKRSIDLAYEEARSLKNPYIGTEHLLLGLIREGDGLAAQVLAKLGVELGACRQTVAKLQHERPQEPTPPPDVAGYGTGRADAFFSFLMGACLPHHLMLSFIADAEGVVGRAMRSQCKNIGGLQWALWQRVLEKPRSLCNAEPEVLTQTLRIAAKEAGGGPLKAEHIFLALLAERTEFAVWIAKYGVTVEKSRELLSEPGDK